MFGIIYHRFTNRKACLSSIRNLDGSRVWCNKQRHTTLIHTSNTGLEWNDPINGIRTVVRD